MHQVKSQQMQTDTTWQIVAIKQALARSDSPEAKFIDHEKIAAWLESWGTEDELPVQKL